MNTLHVDPAARVEGTLNLPGDKSISHRAAILGLLAEGETRVRNFLRAEDCLDTLRACERLGAEVRWEGETLVIRGRGPSGLRHPGGVIDCGNSGTGVRLLAGVLAGADLGGPVEITGDAQIRRRPMNRIIEPLRRMGARIESEPGGLCPMRITGGGLTGIDYDSPVASAQVKSCVLLAGLFAEGRTTVTEPGKSRDHTEIMLGQFGVPVQGSLIPRQADAASPAQHAWKVALPSRTTLRGCAVDIPADISSAAFFIVAAMLLPDSDLALPGVGLNPTRTGLLDVLDPVSPFQVARTNRRPRGGERVADLRIRTGTATGESDLMCNRVFIQDVSSAEMIPTMIDEFPILTIAALGLQDTLTIRGVRELRVKETDRIKMVAQAMGTIGLRIDELPDGMIVHGTGGRRLRGGEADAHGDHRLAMSLAIAGLVSERGVTVRDPDCVNTSFPGFWDRLAEVRRDR